MLNISPYRQFPDLSENNLGLLDSLPKVLDEQWRDIYNAFVAIDVRLGGWINVKEAPYYAMGDGVALDTESIQSADADAKATGRGLAFPFGTYLVNGPNNGSCLYQSATVPWRGYGPGATIFKQDGATNADIIRNENWDSGAIDTVVDNYMTLSGFGFDGANAAQRCVYPVSVGKLLMRDCEGWDTKTVGGGHAFRAKWCEEVLMEAVYGRDTSANGIGISVCDIVSLLACRASGNEELGIAINATKRATMTSCLAWENAGTNLSVESGQGASRAEMVTLMGNHGWGSTGGGGLLIATAGAKYVIAALNHLYDNYECGVQGSSSGSDYSEFFVLLGNVIRENGLHGITLHSAAGASYWRQAIIGENHSINNGQRSTGDGLNLNSVNVEGLIATGNNFSDNQGSPTQRYGAFFGSSTDDFIFTSNRCRGNLTAEYKMNSTGHIRQVGLNNIGDPIYTMGLGAGSGALDVSITEYDYVLTNTGAYTITGFSGGHKTREINLAATNANTTIQDNANVNLSGGVNWNMPANSILKLKMFSAGVWDEVSRSLN